MLGIVIVYITVLFWILLSIWAVRDISRFSFTKRTRKLVWTNIVVIFPFLGLLFYILMGRNNLIAD